MSSDLNGGTNSTATGFHWHLWLRWVLATALSSSLAFVAITSFIYFIVVGSPDVALGDDNAVGPLLLFGCGLIFVGPLVGLAQTWALKSVGSSRDRYLWIPADSVGVLGAISGTVSLQIMEIDEGWMWWIVPGFILGLCQLLALWPNTRGVVWWIPISWASWDVALLLGATVARLARDFTESTLHIQTQTRFDVLFYPPESAIAWSVGFIVGTFLFSAITGFALVWLLRYPRRAIAVS